MCRRVTCRSCGKPTYSGCGQHVEQVLAGVAAEQRCICRQSAAAKRSAMPSRSLLSRLLRR